MSALHIAAAAWPIEAPRSLDEALAKARAWVREAADSGAELLVFPEYGSMELASALPERTRANLHAALDALQPLWPAYLDGWAALAREHRVFILAPSLPRRMGHTVRNQAWLMGPAGGRGLQEKLHMTRFEAEDWGINPGTELCVFDCGTLGKIGVAVCYDAEFPLLVRRMVEAGADTILLPSCTDGASGYSRVNVSARARAIENQCFVVQSPTIGEARDNPAVDVNFGAAGIYGPADRGFDASGEIAQGEIDRPGFVYAVVDRAELARVRLNGQVLNHRDWSRFPFSTDLAVKTVAVA